MTAFIGRREFITLLGSVAAWPVAARAEQSATSVIGFLRSTSARDSLDLLAALRLGNWPHRRSKRRDRVSLGRMARMTVWRRWQPT
jgi:hypothetical protein